MRCRTWLDNSAYRKILESDDSVINLETDENANLFVDKYDKFNDYYNELKDDNVLIIYPRFKDINGWYRGGIKDRATFRIKNQLVKYDLLEAFDDRAFYLISKKIDNILNGELIDQEENKNLVLEDLKNNFNRPQKSFQILNDKIMEKDLLKNMLLNLYDEMNAEKYYLRPDLMKSFCKIFHEENIESIYQAMINLKNIERRIGRNVKSKCIGTTLLTKGLEFDTVIVYNVDKLTCPKNFYVAVSRARKKLLLFYKDFPTVVFDS